MLLSVKKRQEYLKELGFYKDKIDGKVGKNTKQAYKDLQNKYFFKKQDKDGIYGKNTDILLRNAYKVHKYCKNFKLTEFRCKCDGKYCTGYPAELSDYLVQNVQKLRNKYGSTTITSGLRCKNYNKKLSGSSSTSNHMKGKAVDIVNSHTKDLNKRKELINYWFTLQKPNYAYCNGWGRKGKKSYKVTAKNMGNAVHCDTSK